ncbi:MAG: hypothetical protein SV910_01050 [Chloroflexota bacterium]|nr:hypothetical protein [Chloroflexota bacterium]
MKMYDMHGNTLMEASSLERRGDDMVMKGKMMGSMPATIYIRPEEVWQATKLLSWSVLWYMPIIVVKGWWRNRRMPSQKSAA